MGINKATFFVAAMAWQHNRRTIREQVMSTDVMPAERLAKVRACYGLSDSDSSPASRQEVVDMLLEGKTAWTDKNLSKYEIAMRRKETAASGSGASKKAKA